MWLSSYTFPYHWPTKSWIFPIPLQIYELDFLTHNCSKCGLIKFLIFFCVIYLFYMFFQTIHHHKIETYLCFSHPWYTISPTDTHKIVNHPPNPPKPRSRISNPNHNASHPFQLDSAHPEGLPSEQIDPFHHVTEHQFHIESIDIVWLIANIPITTPSTTIESGPIDISSLNEYECTSIYITRSR